MPDDISETYQRLIRQTIRNDLLIQAGYQLPAAKLEEMQEICVVAYQRARNKIDAEEVEKRRLEAQTQNRGT